MPHVIVKMHPGRSDADKRAMADHVATALHEAMDYDLDYISVAVEEVERSAWMDQVYEPDISRCEEYLFKRPGYGPLA